MEEIDLKELFTIFYKKKVLIIVVVVLFAVLGALYTFKFITPMYKTATSLILVQIGGDVTDSDTQITTTDIQLNSKLVNDYSAIAASEFVAKEVFNNLNLSAVCTLDELRESITVTTQANTEVITITVVNSDPQLAQRITVEVANVFMKKAEEIYKVGNIYQLDDPSLPSKPYNVHLTKNVVVFAFVGAVLVSGYILLVNMLDTTVKTESDIERVINVPVLASILYTDEYTQRRKSYGNRDELISEAFTYDGLASDGSEEE